MRYFLLILVTIGQILLFIYLTWLIFKGLNSKPRFDIGWGILLETFFYFFSIIVVILNILISAKVKTRYNIFFSLFCLIIMAVVYSRALESLPYRLPALFAIATICFIPSFIIEKLISRKL